MADSTNTVLDMFQKFGEQMRIPSPDLSAMMEVHSKNLAALQSATQIGASSVQAAAEAQMAHLERTLTEISESVKGVTKPEDVPAQMQNQMALAKKSFDMTVETATEISEILRQGNTDAFNVLRERMMESVEEMISTTGAEAVVEKPKPKPKTTKK